MAGAEGHRGPVRVLVDVAVASSAPVAWALDRLASEVPGTVVTRAPDVRPGQADVVVTVATSPLARRLLARSATPPPAGPERFLLLPWREDGEAGVVACGADVRGTVHAVLDAGDRMRASGGVPVLDRPVSGAPANATRSVARAFAGKGADSAWFRDPAFWAGYLDGLAADRFNRFHLALGMGYDFHYQGEVTDTYFLFPYPFLVDVPGFGVVADGLDEDEPARNLAMLRLIGDGAARRGLEFQLGLWTHGYEWTEGPGINHRLRGLTPENHAPYCREAISRVLDACPSVGGVTLRVHGESGISEGAADFWPEVFAGIASAGRPIEIDLHAKGLDHAVVDAALGTGMPVVVSPKYAAEHLGLPYHLTAIREHERRSTMGGGAPGTHATPSSLRQIMRLSAGLRSFTRYSYGDFLRRDRGYDVVYRVWPGTQRLLLWGDVPFAAALSRSGSFGGARGIEVCEPLFFAGRRGSPGEGVRAARDHRYYRSTYRVLGRLLYDADAAPDAVGPLPVPREALGPASRILPLVTMAHSPSAANNSFWPEMYTNMPIVPGVAGHPYRDTPPPRTFGSVGALDPAMFSSIDGFVAEALAGEPSGRYTPLQVAAWLEGLAAAACAGLGRDGGEAAVDVRVQAGLGRFFAAKMRAAVLYELGRRLGDPALHDAALAAYRGARAVWADLAADAATTFGQDLVFGPQPWLRGSWGDRLGAIDRDLAAMEAERRAGGAELAGAEEWLAHLEGIVPPPAPPPAVRVREHTAPGAITVVARVAAAAPYGPARMVTLSHRPSNQAERYGHVEMRPSEAGHTATLPAPADAAYATQYYLTVETPAGTRWIYPGLGADLLQRPYLLAGEGGGG